MPLTPGYGETPLPAGELSALLPQVVEVLDKPIRMADVYDLEQAVQEQVAVELRNAIDNIRHRWSQTNDWTPRELGMVVHAETVRVHPFADGNGRTTRLLADLAFIAAQGQAEYCYDWDVDKMRYIDLLRAFDVHRDARELAAFVGVQPIGD
jgi:fido (protein-threonine AMPylation protein)